MNNIDTNVYNFLRNEIDKALEAGLFENEKELAEKAGTFTSNLNNFRKGKRNSITFETAYKILKVLGFYLEKGNKIANIKTIDSNTTREIKENDNIIYVPICTYAGAGAEVDYNAFTENELVPILKDYWKENLRIVKVVGDSMEPTIKENSLVGVIPCTEKLKAGKVYLVNIPEFGYIIKRVYPGKKQGTILLSSDNKKHEDRTIDCKGYNNIIVAEIVWVLQIV